MLLRNAYSSKMTLPPAYEEVAVWGGKAGMPMDPCYHLTCDNLGNINTVALALNADAIAYAALHFAMNRLPR